MAKVLITGANGFIGKNLKVTLREKGHEVDTFSHYQTDGELEKKIVNCDFIFHLAGVNRPQHEEEFITGNIDLTDKVIALIKKNNVAPTVIFTSSSQALCDNAYGKSKRAAEDRLLSGLERSKTIIYRLPGVFGKWCRPNYNSVVATFCHNVVNDIELKINSAKKKIELVYIDDVVAEFSKLIENTDCSAGFKSIPVRYHVTLEELSDIINGFKKSRNTLLINSVGTGLVRALYATYLSYLKPNQFSYTVPVYRDSRGDFSELLKTSENGQFSFFTAKPGVVRGGHYHHTKNEKFIVVSGKALFGFKHIETEEKYELTVCSEKIQIVETIPGWAHNIKNIGENELIVLLWANEVFDPENPDTINWSI